MINFSKVSSLAIGLALVGGLGLSNLASANTANVASYTQTQLLVEGGQTVCRNCVNASPKVALIV
ncbi:hypothetical protein [Pseudomonas sp. S2_C03]